MLEWNVVISVNERGFEDAFKKLSRFGLIRKTGFFNVLFLRADDLPIPSAFNPPVNLKKRQKGQLNLSSGRHHCRNSAH